MMQSIKAEFVKPESTEAVVSSLEEACQPVFASIETKYAAYRRQYFAQQVKRATVGLLVTGAVLALGYGLLHIRRRNLSR